MAEMADAAGVAENRQLRWNGFARWKSRWRRWRMPPGRRRFVNYGEMALLERENRRAAMAYAAGVAENRQLR